MKSIYETYINMKYGYLESSSKELCVINSKNIHNPIIIDTKNFNDFLELPSKNIEAKCYIHVMAAQDMDFQGISFNKMPRFRFFTYDSRKHIIRNLNINTTSGIVFFEIDDPDNFLLKNVNIKAREIQVYGYKFPVGDSKTKIDCSTIVCQVDQDFMDNYGNPDDFSKSLLKNKILNNTNINFKQLVFMNGMKFVYAILKNGEKYEIGLK